VTRKKKTIVENEKYILPSSNDTLRYFIIKNKIDMMQHIIRSIEFAMSNSQPIIEIFQFKDSQFVITMSEKEFYQNLDHIHDHYMENEMYELCPRVVELQKLLKRNK
jgi:hypothetical protein